jgi:hypothetical protein
MRQELISIYYICNIIVSSDWKGVASVLTSVFHKQSVSIEFMVLLLVLPVILPLPSSPNLNVHSHIINRRQCFKSINLFKIR